ncbi:MAG: GFA family protein [Hyphomicrobiales bacterium]|nr:GFA family protein [Hyphomicrobiales bacterium]
MKIDGGCLCGHVAYEAEIDPEKVAICHCTDCQINSATAYRYGVPVRRENFRLTRGALKTFVKTAESGGERALSFCPECGTSIHGGDVVEPKVFSLRLGTARQRADLRPKRQVWRRSAMPWIDDLSDMPAHETQPWTRDAKGALVRLADVPSN